jgi:hypothetical protein
MAIAITHSASVDHRGPRERGHGLVRSGRRASHMRRFAGLRSYESQKIFVQPAARLSVAADAEPARPCPRSFAKCRQLCAPRQRAQHFGVGGRCSPNRRPAHTHPNMPLRRFGLRCPALCLNARRRDRRLCDTWHGNEAPCFCRRRARGCDRRRWWRRDRFSRYGDGRRARGARRSARGKEGDQQRTERDEAGPRHDVSKCAAARASETEKLPTRTLWRTVRGHVVGRLGHARGSARARRDVVHLRRRVCRRARFDAQARCRRARFRLRRWAQRIRRSRRRVRGGLCIVRQRCHTLRRPPVQHPRAPNRGRPAIWMRRQQIRQCRERVRAKPFAVQQHVPLAQGIRGRAREGHTAALLGSAADHELPCDSPRHGTRLRVRPNRVKLRSLA